MNKVQGNLWVHKTAEDFSAGTFNNTILAQQNRSEIKLHKENNEYSQEGEYISDIIYTAPFEYLILSWNADTPDETMINIQASVLVNKNEKQSWSKWLSFGNWSLSKERTSISKTENEDDLAYVDTDTLIVKGTNGETACAIRYMLVLKTSNPDVTPSIRLVAGTIRNTNEDQDIPKLYPDEIIPELSEFNKVIDIPRFSQMVCDPEIKGSICSPTSVTMILNHYGERLVPEETAWKVYDIAYGSFGNWPFNTAYAASLGFDSYVSYCSSVYDLKKEIYDGYPVVVSVKYRNDASVDSKHPVIHGAPISKTNGHLIVVCGFEKEYNKEYVIVNDPAAKDNEAVRLKYLLEEFDAAWQKSGRVAYIIHPLEK